MKHLIQAAESGFAVGVTTFLLCAGLLAVVVAFYDHYKWKRKQNQYWLDQALDVRAEQNRRLLNQSLDKQPKQDRPA